MKVRVIAEENLKDCKTERLQDPQTRPDQNRTDHEENLDQSMQSHIGCICLAFLHCVFSNVPSNCLPAKMHSHIGCIYLTFLRYVFSNVSSESNLSLTFGLSIPSKCKVVHGILSLFTYNGHKFPWTSLLDVVYWLKFRNLVEIQKFGWNSEIW